MYNDISYVKTRASFAIASKENDYSGTQVLSIPRQLKKGARAFQLNVFTDLKQKDVRKQIQVCFPDCDGIQGGTLYDNLVMFSEWLDENITDVITIFIENKGGVGIELISEIFKESGLCKFIFPSKKHPPYTPWPTLLEMIKINQRLVVFEEKNDILAPNSDWVFSSRTHVLQYDFSKDYLDNKYIASPYTGDKIVSLTEIPHYGTNINSPVDNFNFPIQSNISQAKFMNSESLYLHSVTCLSSNTVVWGNFLLLDFYGIGNVDSILLGLNSVPLPNDTISAYYPDFYEQSTPNITRIFEKIRNNSKKSVYVWYIILCANIFSTLALTIF
ncbi:hypothetical protein AYI70_g1155 [Smittium culicis]|uniref:PI-PLC X domain-containing protein n=1 Tax=Smittium culicis TaxID=133412 RepID=A0A1R1YEE6_9FUNG|nr:hypothetical protein AYI70_g1155 [Smittium culicis]